MTSAPGLQVVQNAVLADLDRLIDGGRAVLATVKVVPNRNTPQQTFRVVDERQARAWKAAGTEVLSRLIPALSSCRAIAGRFQASGNTELDMKGLVGDLEGIRDAVAHGALIPIVDQVSQAIAGDYLGQATTILEEPDNQNFGYVAAAVLAGAVLERRLRDHSVALGLPTTFRNKNGRERPLGMEEFITSLAKVEAVPSTKAQELRAWAAIRNAAAHGELTAFTARDVSPMIEGINRFLAESPIPTVNP